MAEDDSQRNIRKLRKHISSPLFTQNVSDCNDVVVVYMRTAKEDEEDKLKNGKKKKGRKVSFPNECLSSDNVSDYSPVSEVFGLNKPNCLNGTLCNGHAAKELKDVSLDDEESIANNVQQEEERNTKNAKERQFKDGSSRTKFLTSIKKKNYEKVKKQLDVKNLL